MAGCGMRVLELSSVPEGKVDIETTNHTVRLPEAKSLPLIILLNPLSEGRDLGRLMSEPA